jgi:beta-galactosidase
MNTYTIRGHFHIRRALPRVGWAFCGAALIVCSVATTQKVSPPTVHHFAVEGKQFLLDGKPYQIISGEMHYVRIPHEYWRDRLRKARAMGLNTISTYVFWNVHEPRPGIYDFSGQNDIAEFLREAQEEGLHVILRPGPYVCAEWELGGYPSWLLKDRGLVLRSDDPKYREAVHTWFARLGKEISPLLLKNGGPIMAIQVENEYGSFGDDHGYVAELESTLRASGMGADVLYTADGPEQLPKGSLADLPAAINFGSGDAEKSFAKLNELRPEGSRMSGEYWAGWFDHWGEKHHVTDGTREAAELAWMLRNGDSVNMYMFDGGTSFGWMNGGNSNGSDFQPDTTSYDYDAPLDESGAPRQKYFAFRDAIAAATGMTPRQPPATTALESFAIDDHMESASLWESLPQPRESDTLLAMEDMDQAYGYILYRTQMSAGDGGELELEGLHDYAQVYLNRTLIGTLDRRLGTQSLAVPILKGAGTLDILVENSGRVNYSRVIRTERKGLTGKVLLDGKTPKHWSIYSLAMNDVDGLHFHQEPCEGPCFFRVPMHVPETADTYLNTRDIQKGMVWIDGRPLGRAWSIGPQYSLFTPGAWLRKGENVITFFDVMGGAKDSIRSESKPVFGGTISQRN